MKKNLSLSLALMAGICASAQNVCTIDAKAWLTEKGAADPTALTAIDANSVIVDNEDVTVSTGAADQYKAVDIAFNGYNKVRFGADKDVDCSDLGLQGNSNPKGAGGEDPAKNFVQPGTGAYYVVKAKKDGYFYAVLKASSNKAYTVFEEGKCLSYTLAMNIADDADKNADPITNGVLTYTLPADEEGFYDQSNGTILWPIQIYHNNNAEATSAGNGLGVIMFKVYADCNYVFNAVGSKASFKGFCYSENPVDVSIVAEDGSTLKLLSGGSTDITEINTDKNDVDAPAYNIAGQRVNKNAKGIVIINGKKYVNK